MKLVLAPAVILTALVATAAAADPPAPRAGGGEGAWSVERDDAHPGESRPESATRPRLGVAVQSDEAGGVRIAHVSRGSAGEQAGLKPGDVVTEVDGKKVTDVHEFVSAIAARSVGDEVRLRVSREGGDSTEITARLEAARPPFAGAFPHPMGPFGPMGPMGHMGFGPPPAVRLGLALQPLTEGLRAFFKVASGKGALVSDVVAGSPAERAGLKAGDVVIAIDGKDVSDTGDALDAIRDHKAGDRVPVRFVRDGVETTLEVVVEERPAEERHGFFFHGVPPGAFNVEVDGDALADLSDRLEAMGPRLEGLGTEIEKSLEGLGPRIEKQVQGVCPHLDQKLEDLGTRLDKQLEGLGPEIEKKLEKLGPMLREHLEGFSTPGEPQAI